MNADAAAHELRELLVAHADPEFAPTIQRYFRAPIPALGVDNGTVAHLAYRWTSEHPALTAADRLEIADILISEQTHHEEVLIGFALLHRVAKRHLGPELLQHGGRWLNLHVSNWAQCDDLCLKLLYPFFLGHLEEIPRTQAWLHDGPWARRAANVSVVKFVHRKVGKITYSLPLDHIFKNCTALLRDDEHYVQMSVGWLLKVAAQNHPEAVEEFLRTWHQQMRRTTFRYALEAMPPQKRSDLMALGRGVLT